MVGGEALYLNHMQISTQKREDERACHTEREPKGQKHFGL